MLPEFGVPPCTRTGRPLGSPPSWTRRFRPSGVRTVVATTPLLALDHLAGHRDRLNLERDAVLARFQVTEFLPGVALGQVVDELVLRVRDQADQAAGDLRVAVRHLRIDGEHGD